MKLTILILFFGILTLQYYIANGQPKDFFGRIRESVEGTAKKVKQDVKYIFHPNENNKTEQQENKDESTNIHFVEKESKEDFAAEVAKKQVEVTPPPTTSTTTPAQTGAKNGTTDDDNGRENFSGGCISGYMRTADGRCMCAYSKEDFTAEVAKKQVEVTPPPTTSTTTPAQTGAKNGTTDDDKGRENFSGGCISGYMRTADGRCMPTF